MSLSSGGIPHPISSRRTEAMRVQLKHEWPTPQAWSELVQKHEALVDAHAMLVAAWAEAEAEVTRLKAELAESGKP